MLHIVEVQGTSTSLALRTPPRSSPAGNASLISRPGPGAQRSVGSTFLWPTRNNPCERPSGPRIQCARPQCSDSVQRVFWRAQAPIAPMGSWHPHTDHPLAPPGIVAARSKCHFVPLAPFLPRLDPLPCAPPCPLPPQYPPSPAGLTPASHLSLLVQTDTCTSFFLTFSHPDQVWYHLPCQHQPSQPAFETSRDGSVKRPRGLSKGKVCT